MQDAAHAADHEQRVGGVLEPVVGDRVAQSSERSDPLLDFSIQLAVGQGERVAMRLDQPHLDRRVLRPVEPGPAAAARIQLYIDPPLGTELRRQPLVEDRQEASRELQQRPIGDRVGVGVGAVHAAFASSSACSMTKATACSWPSGG